MRIKFLLMIAAAFFARTDLRAAQVSSDAPKPEKYVVRAGTRIPLVLVNGISTKNSREGDRVYLQTSFPVAVDSRIVIPQGSYVTGTVTQVKRPGRVKGRGELYVRFDSLMLPNGVERNFRGTVSGVDGDDAAKIQGTEGKIEGDPTKGKDVGSVAETAATGATIGGISGGGKGAAIGGGIGGAAGLGAVLLTRGPDLRLPRGTSVEMQLDRELAFTRDELIFVGSAPPAPLPPPPSEAGGSPRSGSGPLRIPVPRPF
jgi:hypothetical protein